MKKSKILILIIALIAIAVGAGYGCYRWYSLKELNKEQIKISDYIEYTDLASENTAQVNWKYVASIIGVIENNNFEKATTNEIKEIAKMFVNDKHKLNSLDTVLEKIGFSKNEKQRAYDYIEDLKYYGLTPSKLESDSQYIKFIESIKEGAITNYKKYKILPSVTIAQAILETGWGQSELASKYNNLFGIKADKFWKGEFVTLETKEFSGTVINDKFRKYKDKDQSIYDHAKFLYENKRYRENGVFESNTYKYQANALQEAGYSTLMNDMGEKIYAKQLIQLIQQYNLQLIDNEAQGQK
ncbi:glycoside hydrolase family 73 protein [Romboutsia lituseburensis]|uniref:glycoside hydrolase family 73 protein n=1 Tax=Romboutsia lituseburensis TaxID=1537 RepID=UPI00215B12F4|nr:glucosaminidase domain-containing protein [Romboutsia lituseburensis]MCR8743763.1 glucosaminidase domain-containing protein [Romboutsia lituseburensis]